MSDIPNYIAVPISLVIGVISTYFINKNQTGIEFWFSKRRDASILKRRDKAIAEYKSIVGMREDVIMTIAKTARVMMFSIAYYSMGIVLIQLSCTFIDISTASKLSALMRAFDLEKEKIAGIISVGSLPRYLSIFSLTLGQICIFLGAIRTISLTSTLSRLSNFDAFEAKVKEKWGNIIEG
jgi:energy-converting hydrogenase Eha subunit C